MSLHDWLLFLHVLSAFALVAGMVLFTAVIVVVRRAGGPAEAARTLSLVPIGEIVSGIGAVGTLAFGIWLAIEVDGYELWDGWIIAALVLWVVSGGFGDRAGKHYKQARRRANALLVEGRREPSGELRELVRSPRGAMLYAASSLLVLLLLVDMIWKSGA